MILQGKKHLKGFTLIEVLIVVVIIAALAAMVIPRIVNQVKRTQTAEAFQIIGAIRQAAERIYATTGSYRVDYILTGPGGNGEYNGEYDVGNWENLGLKDFNKAKFCAIEYYRAVANPWYTASVFFYPNEGVDQITMQVNPATGTTTWECYGFFKKKAGVNGDANPCTI